MHTYAKYVVSSSSHALVEMDGDEVFAAARLSNFCEDDAGRARTGDFAARGVVGMSMSYSGYRGRAISSA